MVFTYTGETAGANTRQTLYTLNVAAGGVVCDILMVGGGGAGGKNITGGGGGGVVLYGTNINIPAKTYTIKVGDGAIAGETIGKSTTGFDAILCGGGCAGNGGWDPPNIGNGNSGGSGAGGKGTQPTQVVSVGGGVGVSSTKATMLTTATLYSGNIGSNGNQQSSVNYYVAGGGGGGTTQTGGLHLRHKQEVVVV